VQPSTTNVLLVGRESADLDIRDPNKFPEELRHISTFNPGLAVNTRISFNYRGRTIVGSVNSIDPIHYNYTVVPLIPSEALARFGMIKDENDQLGFMGNLLEKNKEEYLLSFGEPVTVLRKPR
jgi:hypothetical protein